MAKERQVLNRYFSLVLGYFVYGASRETAIPIHEFLKEVSKPRVSIEYFCINHEDE